MVDARLEPVEDDQHSQEKTIRRILGHGRPGGLRQVSLLDIPFRYERALRKMERAGELSIWWELDSDKGSWTHYVRLGSPRRNGYPRPPG